MKLFGLSLKNATVKWWRSATLGFFILSVSLVMILASSFITAIKNKVENVILNGITGDIQIRSDQTAEGDMAGQYNPGWDALKPLDTSIISGVGQILNRKYQGTKLFLMARQSAFLTRNDKREETTLMGIDPGFNSYKEAFLLTKGRYLDPGSNDEILLTEEQANTFKADVGDNIAITSKNLYALNSTVDLKVVGIGNYIMLSLFSYKANYTSSDTVRKLIGMKAGEATDIILFIPSREKSGEYIQSLSLDLKNKGIKSFITSEEKLKSSDLKVTDLKLQDNEEKGVMISGYQEMGESFKSVGDTMFVMVNILMLFLIIIVGILIINLVYMTGIERYREIGTLRAIGFSRFQVIRIFMGEILAVSILSGLLGILVGVGLVLIVGSSGITSPIAALDFIMGKTLNLEIRTGSIISCLGIITGLSFAASFYPAYKACSADPAKTLRAV